MMKSKQDYAQGLQQQIMNSDSWSSGELSSNRLSALRYYQGAPRGDEQAGCSAVISMDVADMLEAVIAGMMPALETERVIEFEAMSEDDEQAARVESAAVNWVIMSENAGYVMLQECIRDALLLKNGFTKTYVETLVDVQTNRYVDISPEMLIFMLQPPGQDTERTIAGDVTEDSETGLLSFTLKDTTTTRNLRVVSVDPCQMYYTPGWDSCSLVDIPFIAQRILYTRSDLIRMGFGKSAVNQLNRLTLDTDSDSVQRDSGLVADLSGWEPSQDIIECFECYWRVDYDGSGVSELCKFLYASNTVLSHEPWEFVPFATGTGFLQPHRINGMSLFDKLKEVQDVKTATLRQYLDCFQNGNLGRVGYVRGLVNLDHLTNPQPSGIVEMTDPNAIVPFPNLDIGASAQALLDYMDKVRSARGGASLDLQSAEAQIMGETAQGVERQYSVREMLAAMMTRTLAETLISGTYRNVHKALRLFRGGAMTFRNRTGFQDTDPSQWQERNRVIVRGGLSMGEQRKKQQALQGVLQQQQAAMQAGMNGILVDLPKIYQANIDWCRASGIDNPESYFIDPESQPSQQAQQAAAQQAQQQAAMAQQMAALQMQMAQQQQAFEKYKVDAELKFRYWETEQKSEIEEAKIVGNAQVEMQKEQIKILAGNDDYRKGE